MAIYSLNCQIISRGQKKSNGTHSLLTVVAAAAYRAGECLRNLQDGIVYDFTRKQGVVHTEIILPKGAPARYQNRATLWNDIEALEKRCDSQFCRELKIALPMELNQEQQIKLARSFVQRNFVDKGMIADISLHDPPVKKGCQRNPHIHVLLTMRDLTPDGRFGNKNRSWNETQVLEDWREKWAEFCNRHLEREGIAERIDHRSYKARGMDQVATVHLGTQAAALERKGVRTAKGNINRRIRARNAAREAGVEQPTILDNLDKQWQKVRDSAAGSSPSEKKAEPEEPLPERTDTYARGVQRRTYTLLRNVVRQGGGPAPEGEEKDALRGDENALPGGKSAARQGQDGGPRGEALRQPAREPEVLWHSSVYDIKVMASALNFLAEQGVGSDRQLEERMAALSGRADALEDKLAGAKGELSQVRRLMGVEAAGFSAQRQVERLRTELSRAERLRGAVLRVQANRRYAEEYEGKVLFRENYYKKFGDKIDAYYRAVAELKAAGLDAEVTPEQVQKICKELAGQLKRSHQKYLWAEHELKSAGFELGGGRLQTRADELVTHIKAVGQELYELRGELWKWQRAKDTIHNVQESNEPHPGQKQTDRERPSRGKGR